MSSSVILFTNSNQPAEPLDSRQEMGCGRSLVVIEAMAHAMTARDESTHQHAQRVRRYAVALAGEVCLSDTRMIDAIDAAALVHDIGKLGVDDRLLQKPGPLTADEYEQVKQHVTIGADMLTAVSFPGLAIIVRHHHENWDGTGYPDGLRGESIPLGARVLSVVDCYDALTSDRPYRPALLARVRDDDDPGAPRDDVRPGDRGCVSAHRSAAAERGQRGSHRGPSGPGASRVGAACEPNPPHGGGRGEGGMTPQLPHTPTFLELPPQARVYVGAIIAAGAACLIGAAMQLRFEHVGLFAVLLAARGWSPRRRRSSCRSAAASRTCRSRTR